ncbi:transcriptional regulator, TetR family [Parvibaculum lavamentivorans DS-1]|uniref:Transcriptional regulator, TetR family n=1 Tax=Parvibaculum lavamentivorans (strain DS-1 / DSM 13023 / NCIMB 13966) TaxID=402881 RepID=A7HTC4_PARL1|nr:TetR/AcrR family transcriptional regulator [Parvibaculum lavamentivorans]ABS63157.1 transcriptional regulator, TetR family [Parvibaculum lavamentivorans DS-1]
MAGRAAAKKTEDAGSRRRAQMRFILVEAAMQLFARQGVDATTIDEIVDLAGVAKGTFYNYFTDRAEIARAVASGIRHELNAAVEELNRGIDDPAERIARGVRLFMACAMQNPVKTMLLARLYDSGSGLDRQGNEHLLGDIRDGIAKVRIHVPSEEVALHLVVGLGTIAMRHLLDNVAGPEILRGQGYARDIATVLLRGLGVATAEIEDILARPCDFSTIGFK